MISRQENKFIKNPIFLSYTSLTDFLKCPKYYYLKNIYRDPKTGNRVQIASPYLSLGSTVHDAVKWFLDINGQVTYLQFEAKFRNFWLKYSGKRGGFISKEQEAEFGTRGLKMLQNFFKNWKVLGNPAPDVHFPKYNLFENVVLIGSFDYVMEEENKTLHIVDFKTGAHDVDDPTQLYIYAILAEANLEMPVTAASFWYLDRDDNPKDIVLDPLEPKLAELVEKAKEVKKAIEKGERICIKAPEKCRDCSDYEAIVEGKGEFQFIDERYKKDIYFLSK